METAARTKADWSADALLPGFEAAELRFPDDYDGPVSATLVRIKVDPPSTRAFLYIHGFIDYFFQAHLAEECNHHGYNFYALDMRKYGRSLGNAQHPNFCKDIHEYYPEITKAIEIITKEEGTSFLVLNGHSTGGLIAALYASDGPSKEKINALFLNSPFFDFNLSGPLKAATGVAAQVGALAPFLALPGGVSDLYPKSLHKDYYGEWEFDLHYKPLNNFPANFGWLRAIRMAQTQVRGGLTVTCPVLVMHSSRSVYGKEWSDDFKRGDAVLNVAHIRDGSRNLGPNITVVEIEGGLHDLTLSSREVRQKVFAELFKWLDQLNSPPEIVPTVEAPADRGSI